MNSINNSNTIIEIKNVSKSFKNIQVLTNINVDFQKGKITGIIGRNGSGKTMLLKCILGLTSISSGEIVVNELRIGKDVDFPKDIGAVIETPGFLPNYSAYQNLYFLSQINRKASKKDIYEAIRTVGLEGDCKKKVGKYSLGMKQRLGIAQAIMENPSILIIDEPMNGLDTKGVGDIRNLFIQLKEKGVTIIIATHMADDVEILCDRVIMMELGKIIDIKNLLKPVTRL